ncbi:MAG: hypothetical protein HPY65_08140 [Syntrophaceae bacterium]|nr:hypothetical protein [Syntrophaceae bacterium]
MIRVKAILAVLGCAVAFFLAAAVPAWCEDGALQSVLPRPGFAGGWTATEPANLYDRNTLFEHINGEAELFMPYGFDLLATSTYASAADPDVWIVADVYRMGSVLDAFGIYANFRRARADRVAIGADGFILPTQMMFHQDRYFVRLQVTGANSLPRSDFMACGQAISQRLPQNSRPPQELETVRIPALVSGSERYVTPSLLGYAFFRRGIVADAVLDGKHMQIFVVLNDDPDAAREAFSRYRSYLAAEGRDLRNGDTPDSLTAIDPLYGTVLAEQAGRYVAGMIRIGDAAAAGQIVKQLRARIAACR